MTVIIINPRERTRFLRFAVVGIIGAVVDFGVMNLFNRGLGFPLEIAGSISFIAAVISNFTWNRFWTYPDSRTKRIHRQLFEFTIVSLIGLAIRVPLLHFIEPLAFKFVSRLPFSLPVFSTQFYSDNLTLAISVVVVMFWNFFVNRYWTYSDVE